MLNTTRPNSRLTRLNDSVLLIIISYLPMESINDLMNSHSFFSGIQQRTGTRILLNNATEVSATQTQSIIAAHEIVLNETRPGREAANNSCYMNLLFCSFLLKQCEQLSCCCLTVIIIIAIAVSNSVFDDKTYEQPLSAQFIWQLTVLIASLTTITYCSLALCMPDGIDSTAISEETLTQLADTISDARQLETNLNLQSSHSPYALFHNLRQIIQTTPVDIVPASQPEDLELAIVAIPNQSST